MADPGAPYNQSVSQGPAETPAANEQTAQPFQSQQFVPPDTEETPAADDSNARPFASADIQVGAGEVSLNKFLQQTVREVGAAARVSTEVTARAGDLTVKDLNDLAAEFSGVESYNPKVSQLTIDDLESLESLFHDVKIEGIQRAREVVSGEAEAQIFDNWSCCSCTPCCCCAASDPSPFDSCPGSDPSPFDS